MITFTSQAQKMLDEYLRSIRDRFGGSKTVDSEEVVRDITEHIERELENAPQPISEADMAGVIGRLGDPSQWGSESEQTAAAPTAATEEKFSRTFRATPGGTLVMDVDFGSIAVSTNTTNEVVVDVWRKVGGKGPAHKHGFNHKFHFPFNFTFPGNCGVACGDFGSVEFNKNMLKFAAKGVKVNMHKGHEVEIDINVKEQGDEENAAEAQAFFQKHPVNIRQDGDTVTIEAETGGWSGRKEAKYTVSVPPQFNVKLETSGGSISVSDLTGAARAETSGGELRFTRLRGALKGETSGGNVYVTDCEGAIKIETSGSGIEVTGGSGALNGETSGGPITVKDFHGNTNIETSGSGITIENIVGQINAETSGGGVSAVLPVTLAGSVNIETSGGSITMCVPENAAFELDAETSGGSVKCDLPVTRMVEMGRDHLKGTVNGGGNSVRLETSGGNIHVKKL